MKWSPFSFTQPFKRFGHWSSGTHTFYWYWRRCSNQLFFELSSLTLSTMGQMWTSRRPIICNYENRNIFLSHCWVVFASCAAVKSCWKILCFSLKIIFLICFTTPSKTFCCYTFALVLTPFPQKWRSVKPLQETPTKTITAVG